MYVVVILQRERKTEPRPLQILKFPRLLFDNIIFFARSAKKVKNNTQLSKKKMKCFFIIYKIIIP